MPVSMVNPIQKAPERSKLENFATSIGILTGLGNLGVGIGGLANKGAEKLNPLEELMKRLAAAQTPAPTAADVPSFNMG